MSRSGKILAISTGAVHAVVVMVFAAAWYYASEIEDQALAVEHEQDPFDLRGWRDHRLSGERRREWSVSVSGNWRITFEERDGTSSG